MGAIGVHPARDGEAGFVELKDADIAELVAIGIEELVVVDVVILAENPFAIGTQIGLRRFAFDLDCEELPGACWYAADRTGRRRNKATDSTAAATITGVTMR